MAGRSAKRWPMALVTGASSGIGRAFAVALAARGSGLVLVARRRDRLEELAGQLREGTSATVETMVADLTEPDDRATVEDRLRDASRPVDLLVNNAGVGGHGPFAQRPIEYEDREIRLNVLAPVHLTSAALPGMIERRSGGIVNVSSVASIQPVPFVATYAATKAYLTSFSQAVHEEVRGQGVTVLALLPGFTTTEFHDAADMTRSNVPGPAWLTSEAVAEAGLRALDRGQAVCIPGIGYRILVAVSRHVPMGVNRAFTRQIGRHA
ncbi:MAG: SDR family oxidoreductase [Actinomycetota bacterium]|nr:SDR family oxidoreductase [Actinomycetota bacterium]